MSQTQSNFSTRKISPEIISSIQPTIQDIQNLKNHPEQPIKSIVNVRHQTEEGFPHEEQDWAKEHNLHYHNIGVKGLKDINKELVDQFINTVDKLPKPVLVHCKIGLRADVLSLLCHAKKEGLTYDQLIQREKELNIQFPSEESKQVVHNFYKQYLEDKTATTCSK